MNSKTGCRNHTPEGLCLGGMFPCYAYRLANGRLKQRYLANENTIMCFKDGYAPIHLKIIDPFYPRFWPERLEQVKNRKEPSGIFLDDMSDWIADYWPREWTEMEIETMRQCPQHRFYTLTKQPQNLIKWSPFPDNCWVGVTATNVRMFVDALDALYQVEAKIKYLSLEPLLAWDIEPDILEKDLTAQQLDWLIIGACTGTMESLLPLHHKTNLAMMKSDNKWTLQPQIERVADIVKAADKAAIPVFLKDNLSPLMAGLNIPDLACYVNLWRKEGHISYAKELRQEMPK